LLELENFRAQALRWPTSGRQILAQFDDETIVVYQAYAPAIGHAAIQHGRFVEPDFSFARMSWIKPNFLWMMFRSGWGTKPGQEITLGLRLRRTFFESLLAQAVPSTWTRERYATEVEWKQAVATSEVRLQWDPDHGPQGQPLERRAIQLGLRGATLRAYAERELIEVLDLTTFVAKQFSLLQAGRLDDLRTPCERVFVPRDRTVSERLGLSVI